MSTIIGILGGKGSGKTTATEFLVEKFGATALALADPLKKTLLHALDMSVDQLWGSQDEKETVDPRYGKSPRQLLQSFGDAMRDALGNDVFVNKCIDKIEPSMPLVVVSDVRRLNEAARLVREQTNKRHKVMLWRLHYAPGLRKVRDEHESENEWMKPQVDFEITPAAPGVQELQRVIENACQSSDIFPVAPTRTIFNVPVDQAATDRLTALIRTMQKSSTPPPMHRQGGYIWGPYPPRFG